MPRSLKKGPYIDQKLLEKIKKMRSRSLHLEKGIETNKIIKTWSRASCISPEMVGFIFGVHNGKEHIAVKVTEEMVGHYLGEFAQTTKFGRHGGKMQREIEGKGKKNMKHET